MRRLFALLSVLAIGVAGALVLAPASSASGGEVTVGGLQDKGEIVLRTGWRDGFVDYTDESGSTTRAGTFGRGCSLQVDAGALIISGGSETCFGTAGFGDGPGRNGAPFYLNPNVKGDESLTVTLSGPAAGLEISGVSLDIEAVGTDRGPNSDIRITAGDVDIDVDLDAIGRLPGIAFPNYRVDKHLPVPANKIVLTPLGGTTFQLEGDTQGGSKFFLTDVTDVISCEGGTATSGDATLTVTPGEDCKVGEAVFFVRDGNTVDVLKDPSDASFVLEVPWAVEAADYPIPATKIDYFDGNGPVDMVVCGGTTEAPKLPDGFVDVITDTPTVDGWCVAASSFTLVADGQMQVVETLFGQGDPRFAR